MPGNVSANASALVYDCVRSNGDHASYLCVERRRRRNYVGAPANGPHDGRKSRVQPVAGEPRKTPSVSVRLRVSAGVRLSCFKFNLIW